LYESEIIKFQRDLFSGWREGDEVEYAALAANDVLDIQHDALRKAF